MRLFDIHCDTLAECYRDRASLCRNERQIDLKRGRQYRPWCQVFAVWVPDTLRGTAAFRYTRRVLEFARAEEKRYPQQLAIVTDRDGLEAAVRTERCAGLLAVESGAALGGRLERVSRLATLGVRIITLTWNGSNELGHGCLAENGGGLTPFGRCAVREMYRWGIIPDVSHLNEAGFWDAATLSDQPFMASHSLSRAVCDHPRNLTDAQFKELRRRGGLVGLNFCEAQLGEQSFDVVYRHLSHYLELGGESTVAFGGDLDGTDLPETWQGIAVYGQLGAYLLKKGIPEAALDRLFFQNAFDFFYNTLQAAENEVQ